MPDAPSPAFADIGDDPVPEAMLLLGGIPGYSILDIISLSA